jgi:hypothetical protein
MGDEQLHTSSSAGPIEPTPAPQAWEPLTPRGIASFAAARFGRLFLVELIVALIAAGVAVWFLYSTWFPSISETIRRLPQQGLIDYGELKWAGKPLEIVHERRPFISFIVDLEGQTRGNPGTDLSLHFRKHQCQLWSPLGRLFIPYPRKWQVEFNRPELEPRWGAWAPIVVGLVVLSIPSLLLPMWAVLASVYFWAVWLLAYFTNRQVTWGGSWRLASAALMPGAVLLLTGIVFYGLGWLDFWRLLLSFALHILAGWVFLVLGTMHLPRLPADVAPPKGNPFQSLAGVPSADAKAEPVAIQTDEQSMRPHRRDAQQQSAGLKDEAGGSAP